MKNKTQNIFSVFERLPITIVGDGKSTINNIVKKINNTREKINKIIIDDKLANVNEILRKDEIKLVNNKRNYCQGSILKIIPTNTLHDDNIKYVYTLLDDLNIARQKDGDENYFYLKENLNLYIKTGGMVQMDNLFYGASLLSNYFTFPSPS